MKNGARHCCGAPSRERDRRLMAFQQNFSAGAFAFRYFSLRPFRTSWLIVGTSTLLPMDPRLAHHKREAPRKRTRGSRKTAVSVAEVACLRQPGSYRKEALSYAACVARRYAATAPP